MTVSAVQSLRLSSGASSHQFATLDTGETLLFLWFSVEAESLQTVSQRDAESVAMATASVKLTCNGRFTNKPGVSLSCYNIQLMSALRVFRIYRICNANRTFPWFWSLLKM